MFRFRLCLQFAVLSEHTNAIHTQQIPPSIMFVWALYSASIFYLFQQWSAIKSSSKTYFERSIDQIKISYTQKNRSISRRILTAFCVFLLPNRKKYEFSSVVCMCLRCTLALDLKQLSAVRRNMIEMDFSRTKTS